MSTSVGDKDRVIDEFNSELEEQEEVTETPGVDNSDDIQEVPQTENSATNMSRISAKIDPLTFVSQTKLYVTYKKDLKMWSRITSIVKKLQAEVVIYSLDGHSSGLKEKIQVGIGDKL